MPEPWLKRVAVFLATGAYVGYIPFAPGTFGSLLGVGIYFLVSALSPFYYFLIFAISFIISCWAVREAEKYFQVRDSQKIVIDEILGFLVVMFLIRPTALTLCIGFVIFRILDIVKPFPANWIEYKIKGSSAVIYDDLIVGIYTNIILQIVQRVHG